MSSPVFARRIWAQNANKLIQVLGATIVCLLSCPSLFSQASQGNIQGGVFDQSGGAIVGATVTVIDVARGITRALTTDSAGQYVAVNVTPGTYTVRAEAKGFRTVEHSGVLLEVGQNIRVDLVVLPGEQTQTITVTGEVPAIDTTDATLGGAISNQSINALPLNGRNFERLLQLRPGVASSPGAGSGSASTNGRRQGNDLLLVEGLAQIGPTSGATTMNSSYRTGDSSSILPIDAIQEFNTEQNPKAEYGWRDGSVITVGVKSGTNSIHGSAYAFGRDASATDAANYFSTPGISGVTPAALEQFGATAGGPIIKDKLFWFLGYEGLRTTLTNPVVNTIPSDALLSPAQDPKNQLSMVNACQALSPAKISPLSAQLAGLNPVTCVVSPASPTFENLFVYNPSQSLTFAPNLITTGPLNNGYIKGDYVLGPHHHVSGMYFKSQANQDVHYNNKQVEPQWGATVLVDLAMYEGNWTWTPNSTWVNDFRMGYSFLDNQTIPGDVNMLTSNPWPTGYGFNSGVTNPVYGGLPEIDIGGFNSYLGAGNKMGVRGPEGNVNLVDSVSYLRGRHAFKFGFDFIDVVYDNNSYSQGNGQIKFADLQSFLQGIPKNGTILVGDPKLIARAHWIAGFFQDDWRVATRVTLNLGLRYEYNGSPVERHNYEASFNPNVPANTFPVQQVGPGAPLSSFYKTDYKTFSPRLGVAWDVRGNGKTVVRAGASVLTNPFVVADYIGLAPFGANVPSINVNNSGTDINAHTPDQLALNGAGAFNWPQPGTPPCVPATSCPPVFPVGATQIINNVTYTGVTCTVKAPCTTTAVNPNLRQPYSAEWNLDIQRVITNSLTLDVAYVGNHGFDEAIFADINQPPIGAGWNTPNASLPGGVSPSAYCLASAATGFNQCTNKTISNALAANEALTEPYFSQFPYLNEIVPLESQAFSNYNALQVTLNERASHGLSFLAGYTYSHALDINTTNTANFYPHPIDVNNIRLGYGNGDNDIRHRFTFSPTYLIPGIKSPGQMLQGWSVSGIVTMQSGLHWYPDDITHDLLGTGEYAGTFSSGVQTWNYSGPLSAFKSGPTAIPCFGNLPGCTSTTIPQPCVAAAQAPYAGNPQLMQLALASLTNFGCYVQGAGILTPPAYGTVGNAGRNIFGTPSYYNVDLSVGKEWKIKERLTAQFRVEFFNLFNRADFQISGVQGSSGADPSTGTSAQFGCSCATPDVANNNPVLGSGGPRHIQFGLKLLF